MLRRLRLQFPGGNLGYQGQVNIEDIVTADIVVELPCRFEKGYRFDIPDGASYLYNRYIAGLPGGSNSVFYLVGDMRDDLDRLPEVPAFPLLPDNLLIDLPGGYRVCPVQSGTGKPIIIPQVQVRFRSVVGDIDLPVLVRAHGSRIDIDIRIYLDHIDGYAPGFQEGTDGRGRYSLAQARAYTARYEYKFLHRAIIFITASSVKRTIKNTFTLYTFYCMITAAAGRKSTKKGHDEVGKRENPEKQAAHCKRRDKTDHGKGGERNEPSDIAREVGISKGTLYYYYPTKSELIFDITDRHVRQITSDLLTWLDNMQERVSPDRLLTAVYTTLSKAEKRGKLHLYLIQEAFTDSPSLLSRIQSSIPSGRTC